jgi:hypothetical protein
MAKSIPLCQQVSPWFFSEGRAAHLISSIFCIQLL